MGFFKSLFRRQYGRAEGFNFKGERSLTIEDGKVIFYSLGAEDIILTKDDVESLDTVTLNTPVSNFVQNGINIVNCYMVKTKDGMVGQIRILAGEAYRMLSVLQ